MTYETPKMVAVLDLEAQLGTQVFSKKAGDFELP